MPVTQITTLITDINIMVSDDTPPSLFQRFRLDVSQRQQ